MQGHFDHVTPCTRTVPRGRVAESRRVEVICIVKSGSHMPPTDLGHGRRHGLGQRCGICEHLSPTHNLSPALVAGLPAKLNSAQLRRQAGGQCLGQIICQRQMFTYAAVVPGRSGSHVPGRSAAYENQALYFCMSVAKEQKFAKNRKAFPSVRQSVSFF